MIHTKEGIIHQIQDKEVLRQQAQEEYIKERNQVDAIINKMIQEDHEMMRINKMKQEQSKQDMILSVNEKNALLKRQRELEEYEDQLVKKFQGQQEQRSNELQAMKEAAEAQRDAIFQKLSEEEARRRAEYEYIENMRNDLQVQEQEERARAAERAEKNKTINKFITNVESRIYANLSKQLVDNMFGTTCDSSTTTCPTSGTAEVEGAQIYWVKDTSTEIITLTITDVDGTTTTMSVPLGDFKFQD